VKPIDEDSNQLAQTLVDGTKIVITTLQKFPFILKDCCALQARKTRTNPKRLKSKKQKNGKR